MKLDKARILLKIDDVDNAKLITRFGERRNTIDLTPKQVLDLLNLIGVYAISVLDTNLESEGEEWLQ